MPLDNVVEAEGFDIKKAAPGKVYHSTKTYNHSIGLSCCFRQWKAQSHCKYLHGYSIKVHFEFRSPELDERNWVVDFGSLKALKGWLEETFDHKTLVASDDPKKVLYLEMAKAGLAQVVEVPATGCEGMARMIFEYAEQWLKDYGYTSVELAAVSVHEHEGNSARYGDM